MPRKPATKGDRKGKAKVTNRETQQAPAGQSATKIARVPITNVFMGGDYTGQILVGPKKQPMNVILDTVSRSRLPAPIR
jgi:hypothetical protein